VLGKCIPSVLILRCIRTGSWTVHDRRRRRWRWWRSLSGWRFFCVPSCTIRYPSSRSGRAWNATSPCSSVLLLLLLLLVLLCVLVFAFCWFATAFVACSGRLRAGADPWRQRRCSASFSRPRRRALAMSFASYPLRAGVAGGWSGIYINIYEYEYVGVGVCSGWIYKSTCTMCRV